MNKLRSAAIAILFCFLLVLTLSACGTSGSTTPADSSTATSTVNMSVAAGNQQVTVSWVDPSSTPSSNTTYNVYYSTSPFDATPKDDIGGKSPSVFLAASNTTSPFAHTGLTNGTTYHYFVTKVTGSTDGPPSLAAMAVPQAATPAAPTGMSILTGIQASNNLGTVTLTVPNADSTLTYNVYWSTTNSDLMSKGTKIANAFTVSSASSATSSISATFVHNNLPIDGSTYYYIVTAVGDSESAASQVLSAKPVLTQAVDYSATGPTPSKYGSPRSIEADVANQTVTVTWTAPNSDSTGTPTIIETSAASQKLTYTLYIVDSAGTKTAVPNIASSTTPLSLVLNKGLNNGNIYSIYVSAVQNLYSDAAGTIPLSGYTPVETPSAVISVTPQAKVLAVPSALAASAGDLQVSLSWANVSDPAAGAVKYNVYYSNTAPSTSGNTQTDWQLIGTTTTNSFVHSGLATGKTYYYVITSLSDQYGMSPIGVQGESAQSNEVAISL